MNRLSEGLAILVFGALSAAFASEALAQSGPYQYYAVTPCRLIDTRNPNGPTGGPALPGTGTRNFPIWNTSGCGIPATAKAVTINLAVVGPTGAGNLRLWPYGITMPLVATINFNANEPAIANGAIVPLGTDATYQMSAYLATGVGTNANIVIDVTGYFAP